MRPHPFDPGWTGLSVQCNQLVADDEGAGTDCGLPRDHPTHGDDWTWFRQWYESNVMTEQAYEEADQP